MSFFRAIKIKVRRRFFLPSSFFVFSLWSLVFCLWSISCGYTTGSNLASHLKTIHVEPFENKISYASEDRRNLYLPLIEVKTRNAVIDRFQFDGHLKPAQSDRANLILKGALTGFERHALRFTDEDDVQEYRIQIIVSLEMVDTSTKETFWSEPSFVGEATYFVSGPLAKSEETAVEEAMIDLARRIVERTIENW
jgi:hypothetical protein